MGSADGVEEVKPSRAVARRFAFPAGVGMAGLGVGYLAGRVGTVPGSTQLWDIAAQPIATGLAGVGAIGAGYLAFHNGEKSRAQDSRQHQETSERDREADLRQRYTTAAAQLADDNPAIREAGTYAIAALADDWMRLGALTGQKVLALSEMKVCVSLLCSYLRANRWGEDSAPVVDQETGRFRQDEQPVRNSVVGVLRDRAQKWYEQGAQWVGDEDGLTDIGVDLSDAKLSGARLSKAYLNHAHLVGTNLDFANLSEAKLVGANLDSAGLCNALLFGAELSEAEMSWANLTRAQLIGARLPGATLTGANLRSANLQHAVLAEAWMEGTDLTGANLCGADLSGAHMGQANLAEANLTATKLERTDLARIRYDEKTVWPEGFCPPDAAEPGRPTSLS